MKGILIVFGFLFCLTHWSQKETLVFKISKPESSVEISTADTVFRMGERNIFTVKVLGKKTIQRVEVFGSKTIKIRPGLYEVSFDKPGLTYIKVIVLNEKGEPELGIVEQIEVLALPEVELYLCDSKSDSVVDIEHLIKVRKLEAKLKVDLYDYKPQITSFQLRMNQDTFRINGDMIPFNLKSKMYDLEPGDPLEIIEARVMLPTPNRNIVVVKNANFFLINSDQHSVGTRKYLNPAEE